jgi:hypothetical protein
MAVEERSAVTEHFPPEGRSLSGIPICRPSAARFAPRRAPPTHPGVFRPGPSANFLFHFPFFFFLSFFSFVFFFSFSFLGFSFLFRFCIFVQIRNFPYFEFYSYFENCSYLIFVQT